MSYPVPPLTPVLRRLVALAGAMLIGAGLATVAAEPASGAPVGYVRLAHLSPDTPEVDVYLSTPAREAKPRVFEGVGYGVLSQYLPLPVGRYAVSMRKAGAPADEPPVLTTEVDVVAGDAYTVAGVGRYADLGLRVLDDDLSAPARGQAKVRVIQASVRAPVLDVATAEGPVIATGVQFATTTPYAQVEPGRFRLRIQATGATPTMANVMISGGGVYSLLVLDAKQGGLTTELRTDARGGIVAPSGGVETGAGGTANERRDYPPYPLIVLATGALLAVATAAGSMLLRQRRCRD